VAATSCGPRRQNSAGLDTDPAARPGALHPQSRRAATAETALVHADELTPRPRQAQLLAVA